MSTYFNGEGNIGSNPEFRVFPNGNDEPKTMMRLNVYFDNPIPRRDGFEDKGGFWAQVEIWHKDAEHWCKQIYQRGMRVLVTGNMVSQEWDDEEGRKRTAMKVEARRVGILPVRVACVTLTEKTPSESEDRSQAPPESVKPTKPAKSKTKQ
ncbi:MAG: single-stranded DNA-binding protein [Saezia sp.]